MSLKGIITVLKTSNNGNLDITDRKMDDYRKSANDKLVEGKSLRFCGTSLDVENFSKGLMCLSTSGYYIHKSKFLPRTVEKN